MLPEINRQWILRKRPEGMVDTSLFELRESPVEVLRKGQVLTKTLYLSFDPAQRIQMVANTYRPKMPLGEPVRAMGIGQVIGSGHPKYKKGDLVFAPCGWQEYTVFEQDRADAAAPVRLPGHLDPARILALYITGLTAYFGLLDIGRPKAGETVLVSGAAGATGSMAGQIAKQRGCRAVGIAGGEEKCRWLVESAGFDAAIDYRNEDVEQRIGMLCPDDVDVYFDNVGGPILDAALLHMAMHARVVLCGAISQYNAKRHEPRYGIQNYLQLVLRRATARGFIVLDYMDRAREGLLCLDRWIEEGKLTQKIDMQHGFERIPATFLRLFTGENLGKQLLKLSDPPLPVRTGRMEKIFVRWMGTYFAWRGRAGSKPELAKKRGR
uniref:Enoyl reductase (ER) domain-containing protein n=1 Tax=Candidatus Kentrum sp. DK TaxID=2126562 RepID=A0A450STZ3_9GAMM|nr:MAG: hypothetical protein BECKDK2373C_GA0170839_105910 [Candidatus Kentron sp. DK]